MIKAKADLKKLWFDVGIKRYTTTQRMDELQHSCGLMQESKDIQLLGNVDDEQAVVV